MTDMDYRPLGDCGPDGERRSGSAATTSADVLDLDGLRDRVVDAALDAGITLNRDRGHHGNKRA